MGYVGIGTSRPTAQLHVVGGTSIGVYGQTDSTIAVYGRSQSWVGVYGYSPGGSGVFGQSASGTGVWGASLSGYAGFFAGKAKVSGNLEVGSCTGCSIFSDSALKANFSMIDTRSVLDKLAALPIKEWSYKSDSPSVRHLGPMAQDFKEAFNLGADDKHIDMVDANGVTMASVQALYRMMLEKDEEIKQLRTQMAQQQAQLNQVRRAIRRRRARVRAR